MEESKVMDRINFSDSIENINDSDIISRFDEFMLLYDIVGNYENIRISTSSDDEIASFDVTFTTAESTDKLISECHGIYIRLYEHLFSIKCDKKSDNSVHVIFIK